VALTLPKRNKELLSNERKAIAQSSGFFVCFLKLKSSFPVQHPMEGVNLAEKTAKILF
jgi:hypothetical protein